MNIFHITDKKSACTSLTRNVTKTTWFLDWQGTLTADHWRRDGRCFSFCACVRPSVRLSVCLSVYIYFCIVVRPSVLFPTICSSICSPVCPSVCSSVYPSLCTSFLPLFSLSVRSFVPPSICPSVRSIFRPSIRLCVCQLVRPFVRLFVDKSTRPLVHPSVRQFTHQLV